MTFYKIHILITYKCVEIQVFEFYSKNSKSFQLPSILRQEYAQNFYFFENPIAGLFLILRITLLLSFEGILQSFTIF